MNSPARTTPAMLRQLENELAAMPFRGIPLGATGSYSFFSLASNSGKWSKGSQSE